VIAILAQGYNIRYGARSIQHEGLFLSFSYSPSNLPLPPLHISSVNCGITFISSALVEKRVVNQLAKAHEVDELLNGGKAHLYLDDDKKIRIDISKPTKEKKGGFSLFGRG